MPIFSPVILKPSLAPASDANERERLIQRLRLAAERAASDLEANTANLTGIDENSR